jgi:CheY-like chemotaxis protein
VVEDDPALRLLYSRRLQLDGLEVLTVGDGPQALAAASSVGLGLILLDVRMPGMSGLEVLRQLKREVTSARVPVVMLSNECDGDVIASCLAMGAIAWWSKVDVGPGELSRRVHDLLTLASAIEA